MDKKAAGCPRSGIEVFVAAPDCGIDIPVMEFKGDISDSVCKIPNDKDRIAACDGGDFGDVKELAGIVLDSRKENQCGRGSMLFDDFSDVFCGESRAGGRRWLDGDQGGGRIQIVVKYLGLCSELKIVR